MYLAIIGQLPRWYVVVKKFRRFVVLHTFPKNGQLPWGCVVAKKFRIFVVLHMFPKNGQLLWGYVVVKKVRRFVVLHMFPQKFAKTAPLFSSICCGAVFTNFCVKRF